MAGNAQQVGADIGAFLGNLANPILGSNTTTQTKTTSKPASSNKTIVFVIVGVFLVGIGIYFAFNGTGTKPTTT